MANYHRQQAEAEMDADADGESEEEYDAYSYAPPILTNEPYYNHDAPAQEFWIPQQGQIQNYQ
jgi:hypothetical protein